MLRNLLVTSREHRRFASDMDLLRLRVEQASAPAPLRTLALLGLSRRAGTSTLTLGLAGAFAAAGHGVAIVDGNADAPRISRRLGRHVTDDHAPAMPGTAVLRGVNGHGRSTPCSIDVWREVWQALRCEGSLVVVDAGTADAPTGLAAAAAADGALLVVEAGRSRREAIIATVERLAAHSVHVLGVVINKRRYVIPALLYRGL